VIHLRRLLIRPGAIGDFVVSLPALESLRADYTEVWCAGQNSPLVRFADSVQSIVSAGLDRIGLLPAEDVFERLAGFDSIISWYGTNRPEFWEAVRDLPFEFLPALPKGRAHAVEFYLNQAKSLGANPKSRYPVIPCPDVARTFAAIHPFASSPAKRAPLEIFQSIATRLEMPVHWLRGPEEDLRGAVHIDDLYELACWLRGARIFVGNDSGIGHLAAAVGTPVLTLFRATDPRIWTPRGSAIHAIPCNY
jgi:ADP-heptose:LPS heptosyltransferase